MHVVYWSIALDQSGWAQHPQIVLIDSKPIWLLQGEVQQFKGNIDAYSILEIAYLNVFTAASTLLIPD